MTGEAYCAHYVHYMTPSEENLKFARLSIMGDATTDRNLIIACQQGDRDAFRRLFETYKDKVYSMAVYILNGDSATAEDITQEVFVRLFTRMGQFRHESDFSTWLYRMVTNACVDEYRRLKKCVPLDTINELADNVNISHSSSDFAQFELSDSINAALADLTPEQRATVLLKYFEELSYDEIAHALDCSKGTIASRLNRSLKILAGKLGHLRGEEAILK